jgi:ubiquinone/menaquinone biosynthesis C-methylase UbiE
MRTASLSRLGALEGCKVLIPGIGTGLDIPDLPRGAQYIGVDLSAAMLARAQRRAQASGLNIELLQADVTDLPLPRLHFDYVLMHFILAVVPDPQAALHEAARVLRPGGRLVVLDKFLRDDERGSLKARLNPLFERVATRTDVVFEDLLARCAELRLRRDDAIAFGGWFRRIELIREL